MDINKLKQHYNKNIKTIKNRLEEFKKIKEDKDIFHELCFCILTPQSNAKKCWRAVELLKEKDFLKKDFDVQKILIKNTRFYKNKSKYLILMKKNYNEIKNKIKTSKNPKEIRGFLVKNVKGIGYKEASHFLRNIGFENLAILDRHILKNLKKLEVIEEIPKTLTKNKYLEIEKKFHDFSKKIRIPMDELDLLFWSIEAGEVFK